MLKKQTTATLNKKRNQINKLLIIKIHPNLIEISTFTTILIKLYSTGQ